MPQTYLTTLTEFTHFLIAYIHTLLYLRTLYPHSSFVTSSFHNTSIHQSRHPAVCDWIRDAVSSVKESLLSGGVSRIAVVIFSTNTTGKGNGSPKILERFMLDVSKFPVMDKELRNVEIEWESESESGSGSPSSFQEEEGEDRNEDDYRDHDEDGQVNKAGNEEENVDDAGAEEAVEMGNENEHEHDKDEDHPETRKKRQKASEVYATNLSESFRAALITLTTRCAQLAPLPPHCSFNISIELKDEADADPPIGHPQPWIPVQPSLQKTGRIGMEIKDGAEKKDEGGDLGGVRVTPIRTVEAGVFRFETWVEEGKAKFEILDEQGVAAKEGLVASVG
ncbi:DNA-binding protein [Pleomassaria siparia CBS 279.74]|uniref:DNA-binding protein n=1 Tax=Pleomassaria siparia CBS 279.74 TaxID=1314801 RepID=A0A6G1JVW5_9PLEO|nr:DNA-binding protein [Pleomassaria siparia CBS 279.74]